MWGQGRKRPGAPRGTQAALQQGRQRLWLQKVTGGRGHLQGRSVLARLPTAPQNQWVRNLFKCERHTKRLLEDDTGSGFRTHGPGQRFLELETAVHREAGPGRRGRTSSLPKVPEGRGERAAEQAEVATAHTTGTGLPLGPWQHGPASIGKTQAGPLCGNGPNIPPGPLYERVSKLTLNMNVSNASSQAGLHVRG